MRHQSGKSYRDEMVDLPIQGRAAIAAGPGGASSAAPQWRRISREAVYPNRDKPWASGVVMLFGRDAATPKRKCGPSALIRSKA
jgi:hypothetical protein